MDVENRASLTPWARWAPLTAGLAFMLPVLVVRYPPMTDLPRYEAIVGLLHSYGDPSLVPPGVYQLNFGHTNQLFYVVAWALSYVMPTDLACKVVIAATLLGTFVAAGKLADHVGATRWSVPLIAPVALGWAFYWGLASYLVGVAVLLAALPALDRFAAKPTGKRGAIACALMVVLHAAHESVMVMASAALVVFALCHAGTRFWRRLAPMAAGGVLFLVQRAMDLRQLSPTFAASAPVQGALARKFWALPTTLFGAHETGEMVGLAATTLLALAPYAIAWSRSQKRAQLDPRTDGSRIQGQALGSWALAHRFGLLAALFAVAYFVAPSAVRGGYTFVNNRFLPPAFALFVLSLPAMGARPPRLAPLTAVVFALSVLVVAAPEFASADRAYRDFDTLLPQMRDGAAIALVELDRAGVHRATFEPGQGASRAVAVHGGRALFSLARFPISPIIYDPSCRWDESDLRTLHNTAALRPAHDLERYRYVVLHSRDASVAAAAAHALSPFARLIETRGAWALFESTRLRVTPASPDTPLPSPPPETLLERMRPGPH